MQAKAEMMAEDSHDRWASKLKETCSKLICTLATECRRIMISLLELRCATIQLGYFFPILSLSLSLPLPDPPTTPDNATHGDPTAP